MNNIKEGKISQKIVLERTATLSLLPVSRYNQAKASNDVIGKEARAAPQNKLLLVSSTIATMITDEITVFTK